MLTGRSCPSQWGQAVWYRSERWSVGPVFTRFHIWRRRFRAEFATAPRPHHKPLTGSGTIVTDTLSNAGPKLPLTQRVALENPAVGAQRAHPQNSRWSAGLLGQKSRQSTSSRTPRNKQRICEQSFLGLLFIHTQVLMRETEAKVGQPLISDRFSMSALTPN